MNILYFFPERDTYMHQWQRIHIFDELGRSGHIIHVFNPLNYSSIEEANECLSSYISKNRNNFNLFMTCVESELLFLETIEDIKRIGLPTLLICFDNLHAPFMHRKIAPFFDLVWLTSHETESMFIKWGCKVIYMPYAANPYKFLPNVSNEILGVGFIGTPYGSRKEKINNLIKNGIDCYVYSDVNHGSETKNIIPINYLELAKSFYYLFQFKIGREVIHGALKNNLFRKRNNYLIDNEYLHFNSSVPFHEMNFLYSNFALSLGITELRNTFVLNNPIHKLHLRTFEIPMCGGLQFSSYVEELSNYFEDNKEIIFYKEREEMISKAQFYLKEENASIRRKIKINARIRAEKDHNWTNRFNNIFNQLF